MSKRKKPRIALIGPYPPPYGGIAIHIQRLKEQLEKRGYECVVYELGRQEPSDENIIRVKNSKKWLLKYFFFGRENIIHFHNPDWRIRVIMGLMGLLGKKTVISIHNERLNDSLKGGNWFRKQLIKFGLKHTSFIIADNENIRNTILSLRINQQKVACVSAFIPFAVRGEDYQKVPQYVWNFINQHRPVISANAFKITFYNSVDLYGLDMIVEVTARLKNKYPEIGVVFCLPDIGNQKYFDKLNQEIKERNLSDHILFITEPLDEVYPIWRESDIFVRPTTTDGDALSIKEAMYLKIPVVASDVVPRPEGVVLFKNRDTEDFVKKIGEVLNNYKVYRDRANKLGCGSGFDKILEIYNGLAK